MLDDLMEFRWIENPEKLGERLFTFDGITIFNLFKDYPYKLSYQYENAVCGRNVEYESDFCY